ncbi:MAG: hypothetical protein K2L48_02890, partial [Mycoplasmoidaceae bacterium]|nr:hypothetical protein [Mycoplasmoidaceae bacterium]
MLEKQFLLVSSCSKQTFPYSFFVDETIKSTKQETISQLEIADELFYKETQKHYLTTTTEIVKETFDSILLNSPHKLLNLDPVDILQKELVKNSSLVIN